MSNPRLISPSHRREQGQTIVLVALALVTLLAMAALAIDVVTLYVARSEAQRAADAAALVGAKAFVDSGVTTDPTNATLQTLAQNIATAGINSILQENKMAGVAPVLAAAPTFNFSSPGNPQITVTLQRTDLPTFFARIWGKRLVTITATATAEAYNPSSSQTNTGNYVPIAPKCVKPLLVANGPPPASATPFVDPITGVATTSIIGQPLTLNPACTKGGPGTCDPTNLLQNPPLQGTYLAAQVTPNTNNLCPSCQGSSDFEQSIECCDFNVYSCGGTPPTTVATTGGPIPTNVDINILNSKFRSETRDGVQCLIKATGSGPGQGQDTLDPISFPTGPMQITAESGPRSGNLVTTSISIASLPIIDTRTPILAGGQVQVVGFLQVFIDYQGIVSPLGCVPGSGGDTCIQAHVLNIAGCGNTAGTTTAISGGGVSPVPVRLIHQ